MCIKTLTHLDYHSCHFYNIKMYRANNIKKYRYGNMFNPKSRPTKRNAWVTLKQTSIQRKFRPMVEILI